VTQAIQASSEVCPASNVVVNSQLRFPAQHHLGTVWVATLDDAASTCTCPRYKAAGFCKHLAYGLLQLGASTAQLYKYVPPCWLLRAADTLVAPVCIFCVAGSLLVTTAHLLLTAPRWSGIALAMRCSLQPPPASVCSVHYWRTPDLGPRSLPGRPPHTAARGE
jgi:hypothetical protein